MNNKSVSPELVAETIRFCAEALRQKADEIERAPVDAESLEDVLSAIHWAIITENLLCLGQDPIRILASGGTLRPGDSADALDSFGPEADTLRALLAEHEAPPRKFVGLLSGKAKAPAEA